MFEWLAAEAPGADRVWDCATGTGQAAIDLAALFTHVVATDASRAQLTAAALHPRVSYVQSTAEASGLASACADAVVAAQAVHWFDMPAFFREAGRVARAGALVAVWTYGNLRLPPDVDAVFVPFCQNVVGPYWPPERQLIERGYVDVPIPFTPVEAPMLTMDTSMTMPALEGYIGTWSATERYRAARGHDPLPEFMAQVAEVWGDPESAKPADWPMAIRAGRV
ncbi:MAG: class I SAM-dependent methyltransferase [Acidobacteriota bacterium]|nr:class I SAM-dependent methyltransferase [Acidobacteriota bacterium]